MMSFTSITVLSLLYLGASAQDDYGTIAVDVSTSAVYSPTIPAYVAPTTTPSYITTTSVSSYSIPTSTPGYSTTTTSTTMPIGSPIPVRSETCPTVYNPNCPFLCGGPANGPSCSTSWFYLGQSGCTICPGIPSTCPYTPTQSCAYICQARGVAGSAKFCWSDDISSPGLMSCSSCSGSGSTSTVPPPPPPVYNSTAWTTKTVFCPTLTGGGIYQTGGGVYPTGGGMYNGTNYNYTSMPIPMPTYISGVSTLVADGTALFGMLGVVFCIAFML
ncbi:hypothetical protein TWF694_011757 [Orbilia ellipsospora]|uniref:Uncharacterized protein n=1 Tax=Orbilia ellipsospora TaxID=2528407 RepID=A0AAV9X651_9PEZI